MISIIVAIVVVVILVIALAVYLRRAPDPTVPPDVLVQLYTISKRMDVAAFRLEARSEAVCIRRELRRELGESGRRR